MRYHGCRAIAMVVGGSCLSIARAHEPIILGDPPTETPAHRAGLVTLPDESVGQALGTWGIVKGQEGVVHLAVPEAVAIQLSGEPVMAVEATWIMKGNQLVTARA